MNKRSLVVVVGLVALVGGTPVRAGVTVHKTMPPPLTLTIDQLCTATITATEPMRVYVKASATGARNGWVAEVTTERFDLKAGVNRFGSANLPPIRETRLSDRFRPVIERTGSFPEDDYTVDLVVYADSDTELGNDHIVQPVRNPLLKLIAPANGSSLTKLYPEFLWTSSLPLPLGGEYRLTVWAGDSGFTMADITNTIPWFQQQGLKVTAFGYPMSGRRFEPGRDYYWQADLLVNTYPLASSPIWGFSFYPVPLLFSVVFKPPTMKEYPEPYPDPNWDKERADKYLKLFLKWLAILGGSDSPIMQDIAAEIKDWAAKKGKTAEDVDVASFFETRNEIRKEVAGDICQKNGYTAKDSTDAQAVVADPSLNGYTYFYFDKAANKYRVKIKFFSDNQRLGERFIFKWDDERGIVALMIHEFIHAKLYALQVAGADEKDLPFPDTHGGDFDKKEAELFKKFIEWVNKNNKDP